MRQAIAEGVRAACFTCDSKEDLKCIPIATGCKFGEPCHAPVCQPCLDVWYDKGLQHCEEILRDRFPEEFINA